MKRLILFIAILFVTINLAAQKPFVVFGNAPSDLFRGELTTDRDSRINNGVFLWSLDAVVSGAEITFNKDESVFQTAFLSGVGGALGYKHYKPNSDLEPVSDWGVSGAILTKVKLNDIVQTKMKVALLVNLYNFTAGPVFTFGENKLGLLVGANIVF